MGSFNGLTNVNVELTSRCSKSCWMCGRRKIEREMPELAKWGDMDYELVKSISEQIPKGIVVQFHDSGEPLLYPRLGDALRLFCHNIRCLDTNGKLLVEKAEEIIDNLETITVSTFEGDDEADEQYKIVRELVIIKGNKKPSIIIRELGNAEPYTIAYREMGLLIAHRQFHSPMASADYERGAVVSEIGICLDALSHLVIKRDGAVSMCVVFDPHREGVIGDANKQSLNEIWEGLPRKLALAWHIKGDRSKIPLCRKCDSWGVPNG